jgi:hypothetical protein
MRRTLVGLLLLGLVEVLLIVMQFACLLLSLDGSLHALDLRYLLQRLLWAKLGLEGALVHDLVLIL